LALAFFEIKNYTKSLERCIELVNYCPVYYRAHFLLGSIYSKLRKFSEAAESLKHGLVFQPQNTAALVNLGAVLSIQRQTQEAVIVFEKAIAVSPKEIKAYLGLGKLYAAQNDNENANRCFKVVIKLDPDGKLGGIARNSLLPEKTDVEADLPGAAAEIKDSDDLYSHGYQSYLSCDYFAAKSYFLRYLQSNTRDHKVWAILATCQLRCGEKDAAMASVEKALVLNPKNASLNKQASIIYDACGRPRESGETAQRAFELGKSDSITLTLLGISKAQNGANPESVRMLQDAVQKNPNNLRARYNLALMLSELGQRETAKQHLEEILWADSDSPLKEKARSVLNKLL